MKRSLTDSFKALQSIHSGLDPIPEGHPDYVAPTYPRPLVRIPTEGGISIYPVLQPDGRGGWTQKKTHQATEQDSPDQSESS